MNPKEWLELYWLLEPMEYERWVKEKQDPFLIEPMRIVGIVLFVVTALVDVIYLAIGRQNRWMSAACLACLGIYLALVIFFPAYFNMTQVGKEMTNDICQVRLAIPMLLHMGMMGILTYRDFHFVGAKILGVVLLMVLLSGVGLHILVRECRVDDGRLWAVCLVLLLFGSAIIGQVNYVTDRSEYQAYGTEIIEVEDIGEGGGGYRGSRGIRALLAEFIGYKCTVTLADGSEASFNFPYYDLQSDYFYVGKDVVVYYYDGGLGVEYVTIHKMLPYLPGKG